MATVSEPPAMHDGSAERFVLPSIASSGPSPFSLFRTRSQLDHWLDATADYRQRCEAWIADQQSVNGYCECCGGVVRFSVGVGVTFGSHPNLREGMVCPRGLNNRGRLLLRWSLSAWRARSHRHAPIALFESETPLHVALTQLTGWQVAASDYVGEDVPPGAVVLTSTGREVRHEDLTCASYFAGAFQMVIHNDVLEHVERYELALADSYRILETGGVLVFTTPFFVEQDQTTVLARRGADGSVVHFVEQPEYHGDPVRGQILTYYRFGWPLLDAIRAAGFRDAAVAVSYDPFAGLVACNNPYARNDNVPPLVIVGVK